MEVPADDILVPAPVKDEPEPIEPESYGTASTSTLAHSDQEAIVESTLPSKPSSSRRGRTASLGAGALVIGVAGCFIASLVRALRRQQREFCEACRQLRSTQEQLAAKEDALNQVVARQRQEQEDRVRELNGQVAEAQRELAAAREMCKEAATKLEQSMSDLSVTDTELRAARTQLQSASRDLALTRAQLEATEGELGLTRSQNELMKREVDILRRQLREAGHQLEGHILASRRRKNAAGVGGADLGGGRGGAGEDFEDDVAAGMGDWDF